MLGLNDQEYIREKDLVERFGVSRSSIREVLKQLEVEHLIVRIKNKGTTLRRYSLKELANIYELREVLEGLAAFKAAKRATQAHVERLLWLANEYDAHVDSVSDRSRLDYDFHQMILLVAHNAQLMELVRNFSILSKSIAAYPMLNKEATKRSPCPYTHKMIANAIAMGNSQEAESNMRGHIQWTWQGIMNVITNGEPEFSINS
jgi:DNA-binding GntR family transcriptional regulator